ncbi:hypothetical protein EYF80_045197 [Liparis tanakae]|uniref:Uncharacterized protein n=1 Tax=Liparis tanakae TaxID=230148 RepID=A0A4Z2FUR7_9TELE|nr:hypothetical protein EYF80_045197 [Liparis tanakae]
MSSVLRLQFHRLAKYPCKAPGEGGGLHPSASSVHVTVTPRGCQKAPLVTDRPRGAALPALSPRLTLRPLSESSVQRRCRTSVNVAVITRSEQPARTD